MGGTSGRQSPARGLRRILERLTPGRSEVEAEDLREPSSTIGGTPIKDIQERAEVTVCGTVRSVTVRPRSGQVPALVAELDDGTGTLRLVWLGRRHIAGIEPTRFLSASGRVYLERGAPTIFNPAYRLCPPPEV